MEDAKIFDKKLTACLAEIKTLDLFRNLVTLGATRHDQSWALDFSIGRSHLMEMTL